MKKILALISVVLLATASFTACGNDSTTDDSKAGTTTSQVVDGVTIPEGVLGGKKVAVVRNLAAGDHTQQFLDGCVSEGESFGFTVDTYVTDGDDARTQEVVAQCISKGYDGLILSHGQLSYTYDMLKPAIDKGMKVVTFDSMPFKDGDAEGELLAGVTSTAQDDNALAKLSLDFMIEEFEAAGGTFPIKVLKTFIGPGIPPIDRRDVYYAELETAGKIKTVETVAPSDFANVRGDMTNKTAAILPKYPEGTIDAIWGCYDELAKGVLQALNDAGRTDIPMYTIDVSNDDINLMLTNSNVWKSTAAVDPKLIGIVDMRLIAMKFADIETPEYAVLAANNIKTTDLDDTITMTNLNTVIDGWGDATTEDTFNLDWMEALRKQNS